MDTPPTLWQMRAAEGLDEASPRVMAVMYHYVRDDECLPRPGATGPFEGIRGLTTAEFKAQLDQLCAAMEPIDWPALYAWLAGKGDLPQQGFLLTFDDGLIDHAETVVPVLEARGLRGTFFVPGSILTEHRMLSAHAIHLLLSALGDEGLMGELIEELQRAAPEGNWSRQLRDADPAAQQGAAAVYGYESPERARLKYFLTMELPIATRAAAIESLFERHIGSSARWARHWYLGWSDLVRMQSSGHTIGGHGFLHEPYGRLSPADIRRDVLRSSIVLRQGLGADRRPFSFPFGSTSGPVYDACREAGFVHAFSTQRKWLHRGTDPLQMPRFDTIHVAQALRRQPARNLS